MNETLVCEECGGPTGIRVGDIGRLTHAFCSGACASAWARNPKGWQER